MIAPADSPSLAPVPASERISLIDALRGFALLGVLINNVVPWLSGYMFASRSERAAFPSAHADSIVRDVIRYAINDRFVALFSFLFGVGFAIQTRRIELRGASPTRIYARRQLVLLAIGLTHLLLLWWGDILTTYALLGLILIPLRTVRTRTLFVLGLFLAVFWGTALEAYPLLITKLTNNSPSASMSSWNAASASVRAAASHHRYFEIVRAHWQLTRLFNDRDHLLGLPSLFGRFLLGCCAGRIGLFERISHYRRAIIAVCAIGFVLTAGMTCYTLARPALTAAGHVGPGWRVLGTWIYDAGVLGQAAFYATSFALIYQTARGHRWLGVLAPLGRMALTNYLSQTVIALIVFYFSTSFFAHVGSSRVLVFALGIYVFQIIGSRWWLARFRLGPIEWLWRTLTYESLQAMRIAPSERETLAASTKH